MISKKMLENAESSTWLADEFTPEEIKKAEVMADIVAAIVQYREKNNLTQAEFAKRAGVSQTLVSRWESAECNLTLGSIAKIAEAIGATLCCPFVYSKTG